MKNISTLLFLVNEIETDLKNFQVIGSVSAKKEHCLTDDPNVKTPRDGLVQSLLSYSRSMEVTDTESIGRTEWNLN